MLLEGERSRSRRNPCSRAAAWRCTVFSLRAVERTARMPCGVRGAPGGHGVLRFAQDDRFRGGGFQRTTIIFGFSSESGTSLTPFFLDLDEQRFEERRVATFPKASLRAVI